jgi:uncharacterized membrane protein
LLACEMGSMFGMSWWMWLPGLFVVVALIGFGAWTVGSLAPPRGGPLRMLEERYARGEIDVEEFAQRRATLEGSR